MTAGQKSSNLHNFSTFSPFIAPMLTLTTMPFWNSCAEGSVQKEREISINKSPRATESWNNLSPSLGNLPSPPGMITFIAYPGSELHTWNEWPTALGQSESRKCFLLGLLMSELWLFLAWGRRNKPGEEHLKLCCAEGSVQREREIL